MKRVRCADLGFDCATEIQGESEDEVLQMAALHASQVHDLEVTDEVAEQVRAVMQDVDAA